MQDAEYAKTSQFLGIHFEAEDPSPISIMEYVPYTLSRFLEQHKDVVIPPEIVYGILVDVAQALCYLHGGGRGRCIGGGVRGVVVLQYSSSLGYQTLHWCPRF